MNARIFTLLTLVAALTSGQSAGRADETNLSLYRQLMQQRGGDAAALAQLVQITRELPPSEATELFEVLSDAHQAAGALELAAEVRTTMVVSYSAEPAAHAAMLWLLRTYSSSEIAMARRAAAGTQSSGKNPDMALLTYGLSLGKSMTDGNEAWREDPAILFQRGVAARRLGQLDEARGFFGATKRRQTAGVWRSCVLAEEWLADPHNKPCPKPMHPCRRADRRPHLDGVLDEPYWGDASADSPPPQDAQITLASAESRLPTPLPGSEGSGEGLDSPADVSLTSPLPAGARSVESRATPLQGACSHAPPVRFAYDDKHLYLAAVYARLDEPSDASELGGRTRDIELIDRDRVQILLDADRDYATWFELTVDDRGWPADRAAGDASWNPKWYIAAGRMTANGQPCWTIEAAIPFSQLAASGPQSGDAWAVAYERLAPGSPVAPTSAGASPSKQVDAVVERFGLLLFE